MHSKTSWLFVIVLSICSCLSHGLVYLQQDWDKNDGPPTHIRTPDPNCMIGLEYSSTARCPSAAIIAPNFIITAKHWPGVFTGRQVKRHGYKTCENEYIVVDHRESGRFDLDICRVKKIIDPNTPIPPEYDLLKDPSGLLEDADFKHWVEIYPKDDEPGKETTIGGYGLQWIYPNWNPSLGHTHQKPAGTLHWGKNVISAVTNDSCSITLSRAERGDYVEYECIGGHGCSGSPWFVYNDGRWYLVSFLHSQVSGPRLSRFHDWIYNTMAEMESKTVPEHTERTSDKKSKHAKTITEKTL